MDSRTEKAIADARAYGRMTPGRMIDSQQNSLHDVGTSVPVHVTKARIPLPADSNLIIRTGEAIRHLGDPLNTFTVPTEEDVSVEWVSHRNVDTTTVNDDAMVESSYSKMMSQVRSKTTILYFHGGQFWRMGRSPRWITGRLAQETGGRCLAVQFRLSPQNPFPAALVDGLAAYLSLLYPPPGSLHAAVSASDICFAGDSAGGNLAIALLQLILEIKRTSSGASSEVVWNGDRKAIPLPAGIAILSPYVDLTRAFDSEVLNLGHDIIPARGPPFSNFQRCDIWPAHPPRHHVYADDSTLLHPLVSPVTVQNWIGAPPTWICVGEECLADPAKFIAQQMTKANVAVVMEQYAGMPHNFALIATDSEPSKHSTSQWASFIRATVDRSHSISSRARRWSGQPLQETILDVANLVPLKPTELEDRMEAQIKTWGAPPA